MNNVEADPRDWPPRPNGDGLAPAAPRAKRSRLVLGELTGLPVAVAAWVFGLWQLTLHSNDDGSEMGLLEGTKSFGLAVMFFSLAAMFGTVLGLGAVISIAAMFASSARNPRLSRRVSTVLVGGWVLAAALITWALWDFLSELLSSADNAL